MSTTDDKGNTRDLVNYRLSRAHETLRDAIVAFNGGSFNSSMNRLYYASFYAVLALMASCEIETKTHDGIKRMFGLHFIATEKIDKRHGRYYSQILQARIQGDYDDFYMLDKEKCERLIEQGKDFIKTIEDYISTANEPPEPNTTA